MDMKPPLPIRGQIIQATVADLQNQHFKVDLMRRMNGASLDDFYPQSEDTFGHRLGQLEAAVAKIEVEYPEEWSWMTRVAGDDD